MIRPKHLQKGDRIAIISTARRVDKKDLEFAIETLTNWGLQVVLGTTIGVSENQFAGSDQLRAQDLQNMLDDPSIKAIWCAKGGYGTVRIIDSLQFETFLKNPKWIIGYSDITVLHSHIHNLGVETLHAQMPVALETKSTASSETLQKALFGESNKLLIPSYHKNRLGTASGKLVGGNLSILYSLCGSPSAINTDGKILFIEDLDEYLYHIDRMLQNLKRNGLFENLAGLLVGGMTDMNDNAIPFGKSPEEMILEICEEYSFPIVFKFPAGHITDNRALILGREIDLLITSSKTTLDYR